MNRFSQAGNILIGFLLGAIALGAINLITAPPRGTSIEIEPPPTPAPVRVHVNGAIHHPGVYTLPAGSIVQDAIVAAGGVTHSAITDNLNLASPIEDGELIYIFSSEEDEQNSQPSNPSDNPISPKINLNTASASDLETLPGIGPSIAGKIIEFRQINGPFETLDDLLAISGIGPSKLDEIRDYAVVR
jgi:competence protein ComEA